MLVVGECRSFDLVLFTYLEQKYISECLCVDKIATDSGHMLMKIA
jgi:hypothetical protein